MTMETRRMACYRRGARLAMGATTAGPGRGLWQQRKPSRCYRGMASCTQKREDGGQVGLLEELHGQAGMAGFGAKKL
jgi:hypothetical protein